MDDYMQKNNLLGCIMISLLATSAVAAANNIISCKDWQFEPMKQKISKYDQNFNWNNPDCKVIASKSLFPKRNNLGNFKFEKGIQAFVYVNNDLKYICLPGWVCKTWK